MKKIILIAALSVLWAVVCQAADTDVDLDSNDALDAAYGGTNLTSLSANVLTLLGSANYAAMTGLPYVVTESDPTAEPALGNPGTTGWVLSSTDAGVRSWVALPGGGIDFTAYDDITWGAAAGGSQTHTYDTGAATDPAVTISDTGWSFNKTLTATGFVVPGTASGGQYTLAVEDTDLGTNFLGWGVYGDVTASRIHIPPLADPTAGQVMAFAVPGNQTMSDTTSQPVTVGTWVTPLLAADIDDTPSDGNTTQPASSNSVFDGLALKADKATFPVDFCVAISDEATALTIGTAKVTFRAPYAFTLTNLRASVNTAPTDATLIIDVNEGGATVMTTNKIQIETTELTSVSATTQPGLTDTAIADDASMTIDIDQVGSTIAGKGAKICFYGTRSL